MKEIKYQIYHKPTKTIQEVALIDFNNKTVDTYGIDEPIYNIPFSDVEWREYFGLQDKQSKDIFTRDIIKASFSFIYVVEFFDGSFWIRDIKGGGRNYLRQDRRHLFEIIGNIDQHPEILNEVINN